MGSKMWVAVAVLATSACAATAKDQGSATHHQPVPAAHPVTPAAAPGTEPFQALVDDAHARFAGVMEGKNADYIPILATIPSELYGVAIATRDGHVYTAGDVDYRFSIQSVSKPFTAALVMQQYGGPEIIAEKIGVEPTGLPFNSKLALEIYKARSVNPLVNARRDRRRESRAGEEREGALAARARQPRGLRRREAAHAPEGLRLRVLDGVRQPRHREPALQLGAALLASRKRRCASTQRVLGRRQHGRPGAHGRDARQRRREPEDGTPRARRVRACPSCSPS